MKITVIAHLDKEDNERSYDKLVDQVAAAQRENSHDVAILAVHDEPKKLIDGIATNQPDLIFNLMETFGKTQLGAVGVVPQYRGAGLQRRIMKRLLAIPGPEDFVFLFANDSVLEFYPRFGFRRAIEHVYGVDVALEPATDRRLQKLSLQSREHRALLQRIAARSLPVTREFGARDYGGVLLWYWSNFYQKHFWFDDRNDAIVIAVERPGWLEVCDVVAATQLDLRATLARLIEQPVSRIEFGFTPEIYWPSARVIREYTDSPLFVLGKHTLPSIPFKYPILAQT